MIQKQLDPVPRVNTCPRVFCCCVKLDSGYEVSKIAEISLENQQGALKKQLDAFNWSTTPGTRTSNSCYILVKLVVFIVQGDVTWREIII